MSIRFYEPLNQFGKRLLKAYRRYFYKLRKRKKEGPKFSGPIHYEYRIVYKNGRWIAPAKLYEVLHKRFQLDGGGDFDLGDYLSKYLNKMFPSAGGYDSKPYLVRQHALYWLANVRFYSYSRGIVDKQKKRSRGLYWFVGSFRSLEIPDHIYYQLKLEYEFRKGVPLSLVLGFRS